MSLEEEKQNERYSTVKIFRTEVPDEGTKSSFRKNSRAPWDTSALEGIKLGSALRSLREKEKIEREQKHSK